MKAPLCFLVLACIHCCFSAPTFGIKKAADLKAGASSALGGAVHAGQDAAGHAGGAKDGLGAGADVTGKFKKTIGGDTNASCDDDEVNKSSDNGNGSHNTPNDGGLPANGGLSGAGGLGGAGSYPLGQGGLPGGDVASSGANIASGIIRAKLQFDEAIIHKGLEAASQGAGFAAKAAGTFAGEAGSGAGTAGDIADNCAGAVFGGAVGGGAGGSGGGYF